MQGYVIQPWTTVRCSATGVTSFTQDEEEWADLASYADAAFWIDVSEVVVPSGTPAPNVQLYLETGPSKDEAYFQPISGPVFLAASTTPKLVKSTSAVAACSLGRWVRWRLNLLNPASGSWGATFRVRAVPSKQSFFVPTQLSGCTLWLRADIGATIDASNPIKVSQWADQSGAGDSNRNLNQNTAANRPAFTLSDANYNGMSTLALSSANGTFMTSGNWSSLLNQPATWVFVGHNSNGAVLQYIMDGNDTTHGQAIDRTAGNLITLITAGGNFTGNNSWLNPSALLAEFNGSSSKLFLNDFTTALATGNLGSGTNTAQASMTFASHSQAWGGGNSWDGAVAEVIAYGKVLSSGEKDKLRRYLNARYKMSIA